MNWKSRFAIVLRLLSSQKCTKLNSERRIYLVPAKTAHFNFSVNAIFNKKLSALQVLFKYT